MEQEKMRPTRAFSRRPTYGAPTSVVERVGVAVAVDAVQRIQRRRDVRPPVRHAGAGEDFEVERGSAAGRVGHDRVILARWPGRVRVPVGHRALEHPGDRLDEYLRSVAEQILGAVPALRKW